MNEDRHTAMACAKCPCRHHSPRSHRTNPLPLNILAAKGLRGGYYMLNSLLPTALTVASIPSAYWLFTFLTHVGTLQAYTQPNSQPYQLIYNLSLLVTTVDIMFAAYILGWGLNMAVARYLLRWPKRKIIRVFLYSHIPGNWRQEHRAPESGAETWAEAMARGKTRYVLRHGILAWGFPGYLLLATAPAFTDLIEPMEGYYTMQLLMCMTGGTVFALIMWHISEMQYLNHVTPKPKE